MRTNGLLELETVRKRKTEFLAALQEYKDCDPVVLRAKEASIKRAKLHANRWTGKRKRLYSFVGWQLGGSCQDLHR